jgi:peptidyl-tRNA hydrolase, PTH1 family
MCLSYFAKKHTIRFDKTRGYSRIGEGEVDGTSFILARPQTYMNASGTAVKALLNKTRSNVDDLIVIHDDLDLSFGRIRIRKGGSSGGHNGIKSIISNIGTEDFIRIRIGIGRPDTDRSKDIQDHYVIGYVLSDFTEEESQLVQKIISRVSDALDSLISIGLVQTMNRFNTVVE